MNEMKDKNFKNYEFCCLDIKSMYPSISTDKAIKLLSRLIFQKYKNLKIFLSDERCKKMSPCIFEIFMRNILIELNNVSTEIGFFKQTSGLPMGSPPSALIANIYVSEIETKILPEFLENGTVQFYRRYADDSACLIRERPLPKLLKAFNQYDKNIKWLSETMINDKLPFLDTEIIIRQYSIVTVNLKVLKSIKITEPQYHHERLNSQRYLVKYIECVIQRPLMKPSSKPSYQ